MQFYRALEKTGIKVVLTPLDSKHVPLGLLRNRGAQIATGEYVLFLDVDLAVSWDFLQRLERWLKVGSQNFAIIPCLYGTSLGTDQLVGNGVLDIERTLSAFYEHRRDLISYLALNTSTVAIRREHYSMLGGFDERYLDHGLEDFDFLLRMALRDTTLPIPTDLLTDVTHQSPAFSSGFRAVLNLLSLPVFLDGVATLHRWHRRPARGGYYQRRRANWCFFQENIARLLGERATGAVNPDWLPLIRKDGTLDSLLAVYRLLERAQRPPQDPSALFDNVPQHYFHPDRTRRRFVNALARAFRRSLGLPTPDG
jgi:predicted glycosyltransferase involved in capsule biosynthesis